MKREISRKICITLSYRSNQVRGICVSSTVNEEPELFGTYGLEVLQTGLVGEIHTSHDFTAFWIASSSDPSGHSCEFVLDMVSEDERTDLMLLLSVHPIDRLIVPWFGLPRRAC